MISKTISGVSAWLGLTLQEVRRGTSSHALPHLLALLVLSLAMLESIWLARPMDFSMVSLFILPIAVVFGAVVIADLAAQLVRFARNGHKGSVAAHLANHVLSQQLAPQRVANAIHVTIFFVIFMTGNLFIREAIPHANPYTWDQTFAAWGRILHFGAYPHEWLAPLLNRPVVTIALAYVYSFWFFVMFAVWFWQGFSKEQSPLRLRFLLAFGLTWFVGCNLLGTLLSSVGPCFYGRLLGGPDPYAPLMDYLRGVGENSVLGVLKLQDLLWHSYLTGEGPVRGITAMPSMHVATSVVFALLGFASGKRWLGWFLAGFAILIMIGSVQLGWHYAIDGYAGIGVAFFSWWAAGKLTAWNLSERQDFQFSSILRAEIKAS